MSQQLLPSTMGLLLVAVTVACGPRAMAKDHFLTIGGGYDSTGNQRSIETNVLFHQDVLRSKRPDNPPLSVFFADGLVEDPDLQYFDEAFEKNCPPARRMMAELLGDPDAVALRYRNHKIQNVDGPTEADLLSAKFRQLGRDLRPGDRLIVYVDGHGDESYGGLEYDYEAEEWVEKKPKDGQAPLYNRFDTSFLIWNSESVDASQFNRWLDRIDREVTVVLIMGQCYGGGFSHAIFHGNDAELGLSPHARCGFFAQVHDREAAGCTPDDEIEEYSSYFWSALAGESRTSKKSVSADYNGDGKVSFAEAHSYAILESETFDIPVQTSGALLRRYSRIGGQRSDQSPETPLQFLLDAMASTTASPEGPELRSSSGPLTALDRLARPEQAAILRGLAQKLALGSSATVEMTRIKLGRLQSASSAVQAKLEVASATLERMKAESQEDVYAIWPELQLEYSPVAAELMAERADEFFQHVNALTSYEALRAARQRVDELTDELFKAEAEQAKAERMLQTIDEIVLAANLAKTATPEIVERYEQIVRMEQQGLEGGSD